MHGLASDVCSLAQEAHDGARSDRLSPRFVQFGKRLSTVLLQGGINNTHNDYSVLVL